MDGLLALLAIVVLAIPVGVIVLFVMVARLRARTSVLEAEVARLRTGSQSPIAPDLAPAAPAPASPPMLADVPIVPEAAAIKEAGPAPAVLGARVVVAEPEAAPITEQDRPLVIRRDRLAALVRWLRENWVIAVAAASLALAGVFFVQYGIEKGLLPPPARVAAAILFGLSLIGGGEWLRRRDAGAVDTPSSPIAAALCGAGVVAVFAGVAAGRLMYGLYGPGVTFAGLGLAAAGAISLGWRHGPLLVAVGLIGGAATPFLLDGGTNAPDWLYVHYLLLVMVGLAVDSFRRWAWVSVLALVLGQLGLYAMFTSGASLSGWLVSLSVSAFLAIILPERTLIPAHDGPGVLRALWRRDGRWPNFPVRLAVGNLIFVVLSLVWFANFGTDGTLAFILLAGLAVVLLVWAERADGLEDLALIAALGFLAKLALARPMIWTFAEQAIALRPPETSAPGTVTFLLVLAALISAASAWRSLRSGALPYALGAVMVAPLAVATLEFLWEPAPVLGDFGWALHVMAVAAGMVGLAVAFARADAKPGRRSAWATLSALSLIALALFLLTSAAALTLALAVLLVTATALDRRFELPEMGWFVQLGAAVLSWRLVADPGINWAEVAPTAAVLAAYLGVAAACWAGLRLLPETRVMPRAVLESLGLAALALLVNVLVLRLLRPAGEAVDPANTWIDLNQTHWGSSLHALPWIILGATQLWRAGAVQGFNRTLRLGIAALAGLVAALGLLAALVPYNPLISPSPEYRGGLVLGPAILDSLALAYALPGLLALVLAGVLKVLPPQVRRAMRLAGIVLCITYVGLEIRRLWHGPWIGGSDVLPAELYSYTLAMLLAGAVLLWQALARRSVPLRRIAMAVIGLTVVKVFLWDAAGLTGLLRVVSFAGLGLGLAGLAWLNRWAAQSVSEPRDGV